MNTENQNQESGRPPEAMVARLLLDDARTNLVRLAELPPLQVTATQAVAALTACLTMREAVPRAGAEAISRARETLDAGAEAAGQQIRGSRADVEAAERTWMHDAQRRVVQRVLAGFGPKIQELASAAAEKLTANDDAIERETLRANDCDRPDRSV